MVLRLMLCEFNKKKKNMDKMGKVIILAKIDTLRKICLFAIQLSFNMYCAVKLCKVGIVRTDFPHIATIAIPIIYKEVPYL